MIKILVILIFLISTFSLYAQCEYDLIDDGVALEYPIVSITPPGDTVNIYVIERSIIMLFDINGLIVFNAITYGDISLDMSELESGKYYLIVNQNKYEFYVQTQKH